MQDRQGTNLNRVILTDVSTGESKTYDLERDSTGVTEQGTPLNTETLLSDDAAQAVETATGTLPQTPSGAFIALAGGTNQVQPLDKGGTGVSLTSAPLMTVNLGSSAPANVFQTTPQPGVTGTLSGDKVAAATKTTRGTVKVGSGLLIENEQLRINPNPFESDSGYTRAVGLQLGNTVLVWFGRWLASASQVYPVDFNLTISNIKITSVGVTSRGIWCNPSGTLIYPTAEYLSIKQSAGSDNVITFRFQPQYYEEDLQMAPIMLNLSYTFLG